GVIDVSDHGRPRVTADAVAVTAPVTRTRAAGARELRAGPVPAAGRSRADAGTAARPDALASFTLQRAHVDQPLQMCSDTFTLAEAHTAGSAGADAAAATRSNAWSLLMHQLLGKRALGRKDGVAN